MRLLVLLVTSLVACGYGPPAQLACNDLARATCERHADCSSGTFFPRSFADLPSCMERMVLDCVASLAAPGSRQTPLDVEHCALGFHELSCSDLQTNTMCGFTGTRASGQRCTFAAQCASGYCADIKLSTCGQCAAPPVAGAACVTSSCAVGQLCEGTSNTCVVPDTAGATCSSTSGTCAADLTCVEPTGSTTGTCMPYGTELGSTCGTAPTNRCNGGRGLGCQSATAVKSCQPEAFVGDGAACGALANGDIAICTLGGVCYDATGPTGPTTTPGTCKQPAADGAACDALLGPPCLSPARCVVGTGTAGTCTLPSADSCG